MESTAPQGLTTCSRLAPWAQTHRSSISGREWASPHVLVGALCPPGCSKPLEDPSPHPEKAGRGEWFSDLWWAWRAWQLCRDVSWWPHPGQGHPYNSLRADVPRPQVHEYHLTRSVDPAPRHNLPLHFPWCSGLQTPGSHGLDPTWCHCRLPV